MRWFFVEDIKADDATVRIAGTEFTHLKKALRLKPGSAVSVFNGKGLKLSGRIESVGMDNAVVTVEGSSLNEGESALDLTLVQGLLKGDKPEMIVQKTTELGVKRICFYSAPRTVPALDEGKARDRVQRWRRVAIEAAKQCGRTMAPHIDYVDFASALKGRGEGLRVVLWENERSQGIGDILERCKGSHGPIALLVGPEGGFSADDMDEAVKKGFIPVSLGRRILRAETAAIAGVSIIQHRLGDLG
ncbi:MAG: 16S rRNA (uracil(1498)-N(3))-methyltransferase [Deltaproteobacteria bacterium]|nr:16S rRNA (uracil(1498)-N(3))-methyltransferase [Deltaproteobacteria bacterium]